MKYKVGNISDMQIMEERFRSLKFLDIQKPITNIFIKKTNENLWGKLLLKEILLQLKNIPSLYLTGLHLEIKCGINNKEKINEIKPNKLDKNAICSLKNTRKTFPSQNIKFQKLSLFSRSLTQFISTFKISCHTFIVHWSLYVRKVITLITLIIGINNISSIAYGDISSFINKAEIKYAIPKGLLGAIASVESGIKPYALNVSGNKVIAMTEMEALKHLEYYLGKGYINIDVGVMQINWRWHGENFSSLEEIINPESNITYAAKLLRSLYERYGDWRKAVQIYHSSTPKNYKKYSRKIITTWLNS